MKIYRAGFKRKKVPWFLEERKTGDRPAGDANILADTIVSVKRKTKKNRVDERGVHGNMGK